MEYVMEVVYVCFCRSSEGFSKTLENAAIRLEAPELGLYTGMFTFDRLWIERTERNCLDSVYELVLLKFWTKIRPFKSGRSFRTSLKVVS